MKNDLSCLISTTIDVAENENFLTHSNHSNEFLVVAVLYGVLCCASRHSKQFMYYISKDKSFLLLILIIIISKDFYSLYFFSFHIFLKTFIL